MSARKNALEILFNIIYKNGFSNVLLNKFEKESTLSKVDKSFVFKIVYGTIQYKIYLEYVLNKLINPNITDIKIQILLWMSLYQIIYLKSPDYAIVNEAVNIAKEINANNVNLVNKILRTIIDNKDYLNIEIKNNQNKLPLKNGIPFWMYKKIEKEYSKEIAMKFTEYSVIEPKLSFRINTIKISEKDFLEKYSKNLKLEKSKIAKNCYLTDSKIIGEDFFKEGLVIIQDQTSILATEILDPKANSKILDMCCAPGGKLTSIAALSNNKALIYGCEINENKRKLIEQNVLKTNSKIESIFYLNALDIQENNFDYILLDAPCSGIGVIRKKPEIRLKNPKKLFYNDITNLQRKLLAKAHSLLKVGGELVYSTCTINIEENQNQAKWFKDQFNDIKIIYEKQFFGFESDNNGFYICKFKK